MGIQLTDVPLSYVFNNVLLLYWLYSPTRAFASLMNLLQTLGARPHFCFPNRQFFLRVELSTPRLKSSWGSRVCDFRLVEEPQA
jgi:hypothetical protein